MIWKSKQEGKTLKRCVQDGVSGTPSKVCDAMLQPCDKAEILNIVKQCVGILPPIDDNHATIGF